MRGRAGLCLVAWLALAPGCGAAAAETDLSQESRALRLERQARTLRGALAAMEAQGLAERLRAGVRERLRGARGDAAARQTGDPGSREAEYVRVRDGWLHLRALRLFLALDDAAPAGTRAGLARATATILDVQRQLAARGIELLVAPIPTRLHVYPELVAAAELPPGFAGFAPGLTRFLLGLVRAGVEVVDLLPTLAAERGSVAAPAASQVFLPMNRHWTPKGAEVAARAVARHAAERAWVRELGAGAPAGRIEAFERRWWGPTSAPRPPGVSPPALRFARVVDAAGELLERKRRDSPLLVLGDSFSQMFRREGADFARHLHHQLGFAPDLIAQPGAGVRASRVSLARRPGGPGDKRLVLWMFAAPALIRVEAWEPVELFVR